MPSRSLTAIRSASASRVIIVPVGLAGLATSTPLQRRLAMRGQQRVAGQRVAGVGVGLDLHRHAAERGEDVAIGRIARHRDRDAVAGLEHRQERQHEGARGAGGDDDALGVDRTAIGLVVVLGDPRPQRRDAERRGIADRALLQRGMRGLDRGARRRGGGLADLAMDHMAAGGFDPLRGRHHVHHHERRQRRCGRTAATAPRSGPDHARWLSHPTSKSAISSCLHRSRQPCRCRSAAAFGGYQGISRNRTVAND